LATLSSTFVELSIRVIKQKTSVKQSTTYRMNSTTSLTPQQQAKEFRRLFRVANSQSPTSRNTQRTLIVEEFKEFLEAESLFRDSPPLKADALKELADLVYVCYQYAENMRWDLDEALRRVHLSNLSKLDENDQPIYRADGKVLKGPNYQPPYLDDLV
jgi:predicted HAD superfamily Cof-like phosphohydrolase